MNKQHEHKDQLHVVKRRDMQGRTCTDCTSLLKLEVLAAASVAVALQLAHCPAHALAAIPPPRYACYKHIRVILEKCSLLIHVVSGFQNN